MSKYSIKFHLVGGQVFDVITDVLIFTKADDMNHIDLIKVKIHDDIDRYIPLPSILYMDIKKVEE